MGTQHEWRAFRHIPYIVHEDDPLVPELLDHMSIVDDLVIAVDRRLEHTDHPGKGFDGLLDAGAEATRFGQKYSLDRHPPSLPAGRTAPLAAVVKVGRPCFVGHRELIVMAPGRCPQLRPRVERPGPQHP